ncbi:MAG: DNA repair exonuclease [Ruminococcaceae bacterium]|nr:DNA repair exonuclease [Oscillospiraceae bacterium]
MLRFIHCADIHLGSKMEAKLPEQKVEERRREIRMTFNKMIDYAKANGVRAILLSGDVFDSDRPLRRDKLFFYEAVKGNPDMDFIYLRGNHDSKESYTEEGLLNLKTFSSEWSSYSYGDVDITGLELSEENELSLYSTLNLDSDKLNIVMLHGTVSEYTGRGMINVRELKNRNIDYLALGHYHSFRKEAIDMRGMYAYSGCLEGRGFDETGEKGFVLLEIDEENKKIKDTFVPFACRTVRELCVDISDCEGSYSAYKKICDSYEWSTGDLLRVILSGEITFDSDGLSSEIEELLSDKCYFASVKDKTHRRISLADHENDTTLRGEFVRSILLANGYTDEEKQQMITYGLRVLDGREAEL